MEYTIDVSLEDFDVDEIVEYLEDNGYIVTPKETGVVAESDPQVEGICRSRLSYRPSARDFLTDILELQHLASEDQIIDRIKQIINQ